MTSSGLLLRNQRILRTAWRAGRPSRALLSTEPFYGSPRASPQEDSSSPQLLQRLSIAVQSATTAFLDPARADAVAALGEVTGHVALESMRTRMMQDETGRLILQDRPVVSHEATIEPMLKKAGNSTDSTLTFGTAYHEFMQHHGFDPDHRSKVQYVADPELAYIMLRYRQCHDYWHTLTGLPPTVLGELGLKWLELLQTNLPVAALSATVGSLRLTEEERHVLHTLYLPWAVRQGKQASYLLNVYYEKEFDTPLEDLRERLCLEPAPSVSTTA